MKAAKLRGNAWIEEIHFRASRGLDKSVIRALAQQSTWVAKHENIFILGPTGVGKSFVAFALAQKAGRDGYSAYLRKSSIAVSRSGTCASRRQSSSSAGQLGRVDVLVIDVRDGAAG